MLVVPGTAPVPAEVRALNAATGPARSAVAGSKRSHRVSRAKRTDCRWTATYPNYRRLFAKGETGPWARSGKLLDRGVPLPNPCNLKTARGLRA